ncbi:helix-turn-helix domain-containing protein [Filimonas effusa]|uniref:AraC family transcriptional regulator n=1 Tax=Filimonas effusa TaxID=2508721 RepID=A0A4V1MAM4_9BACT|nr:helix-turn-helix domain-containing protein [Filimonas effusa]RXK86386.1 AraC family transcriptional regulator [Filimonas effusa]
MDYTQQILFLASALGAVNGLLLSLYLFASRKTRSLPAFFLGLLLLALSIEIVKTVFVYFNPDLPKIYLQIGASACFLIGPALYYFLRASLKTVSHMPVAWKRHWGLLAGIILIGGSLVPYASYPDAWCRYIMRGVYTQWFVFLVLSGLQLKPVFKVLKTNRSELQTAEKFWLLVFLGNCLVFFFYVLSKSLSSICISGAIIFSFCLYLTILFYLYNANLENILQVRAATPDKPEKRKIADTNAQQWIEKLEQILHDKQLYKDPNLKLHTLAQKMNISGHLLSQLLNENLGKSFSTYINEYRINEACKLISVNDHLTLEAIGYEVGYNSKSTFYASFKKIKDTTPAFFKESLEKTTPSQQINYQPHK